VRGCRLIGCAIGCNTLAVQIDEENRAEEARLPTTKDEVVGNQDTGEVQLSKGAQNSLSANGGHTSQHAGHSEGQVSGVDAESTGQDKFDSKAQLQRVSSQRRNLCRKSFGVQQDPEYTGDWGYIEEPNPASQIERVSAARSERSRSGSFNRSASLNRDRPGSFRCGRS